MISLPASEMFKTLNGVSGLIRTSPSMRELGIIFVAKVLALYKITFMSFLIVSPFFVKFTLCQRTVSNPNGLLKCVMW